MINEAKKSEADIKKQKVAKQQGSSHKKQHPVIYQESIIIVHRGPIYLMFDD